MCSWKSVALGISAQTGPMPCSRKTAIKLTRREKRSRGAMTIPASFLSIPMRRGLTAVERWVTQWQAKDRATP